MPHDVTLLRDIALAIIFAALLAHLAHRIRQPLLLGYIAGGVLLGPNLGLGLVSSEANIELIAEIGLILLLFIIGLEIDLRELRRLGRSMLGVGLVQFVINVLLGLGFFAGLGYAWGGGNFDLLYLAVVTSLSSTLIVVKLLHDKFELKLLPGRLTLGVLMVQDIWAILFLALQPNLAHPGLLNVAQSIGGGALLVVVAFAVSRYLLARLLDGVAHWPELVLISAMAWCFALSAAAASLGVSREMGALIAGLSISSFPYGSDVISKVTGVRDFFVTLFFVALGMKVPVPSLHLLLGAGLIGMFVLVSRFIAVAPAVALLGNGLYAGVVSALNLAQISEFSLVIVTLGIGYGHVSQELGSVVLTSMILTSLLAPYLISGNDRIARWLLRPILKRPAAAVSGSTGNLSVAGHPAPDVVLLGHFRIADAVLDLVEQQLPHLKPRITLVSAETNPGREVQRRGFRWTYGDLANLEALQHIAIDEARVIATTVSDTFLKGTNTRRLVKTLRRMAPNAIIVMTGEEKVDAEELLQAGADHVLIPGEITGERVVDLLRAAGYR
jgi:Kef-type K+ transport system membrane component KefB